MSILSQVTRENSAAIAVDCLNTFMKADGKLSLSFYQSNVLGLDGEAIQREIDEVAKRTGELRRFLYDQKVPHIQFQDAHVIESIHGKRFHSLEIVRDGQEPDWNRSFPAHALLDRNRRHGTPDQLAIDEIAIPAKKQIFIRWFALEYPDDAMVDPETELIFMKDDFCMSPGSPYVDRLIWDLRRRERYNLVVFGVCDEVCNLRNTLLLLASIFNVIYVSDCTYPLDPKKRQPAIDYMRNFNPLGDGSTGQFQEVTAQEVMNHYQSPTEKE